MSGNRITLSADELAGFMADAARYRYLRDHCSGSTTGSMAGPAEAMIFLEVRDPYVTRVCFDAAIDQALSGEARKQGVLETKGAGHCYDAPRPVLKCDFVHRPSTETFDSIDLAAKRPQANRAIIPA